MREGWRYAKTIGHWVLAEWSDAGDPVRQFAMSPAARLTAVAARARRSVAEALLREGGIEPPAFVFDGPPDARVTLTCQACWHVSYAADAVSSRRCPACGHAEGTTVVVAVDLDEAPAS